MDQSLPPLPPPPEPQTSRARLIVGCLIAGAALVFVIALGMAGIVLSRLNVPLPLIGQQQAQATAAPAAEPPTALPAPAFTATPPAEASPDSALEPSQPSAPPAPPAPTATPLVDDPTRPVPATVDKPEPDALPIGRVGNGGNLRSAPTLDPGNVLAQVCPGDEVELLSQQSAANLRWLEVRLIATASDCVADRAAVGSIGWLADSLIDTIANAAPLPTAPPPPPPAVDLPAAGTSVQQARVANGGNLRSERLITPDTVLAQVCPDDTVLLLEQVENWARIRVIELAPDCVPERAPLNTEGWLSVSLLGPVTTVLVEAEEPPTTSALPAETVPAVPEPVAPQPTLPPVAGGSGDLPVPPDGKLPLQGIDGSDFLQGMTFAADGNRVAAGTTSGAVLIWQLDNAAPLLVIPNAHTDWVRSVAFSPDGTLIASGADDQLVRVWRVRDGQVVHTLEGHTDWVRGVVFSPDGRTLASVSDDQTVRLWDMANGSLSRTLQQHSDWVRAVAFSPDGTRLASAADDRTVCIWDATTGELLQTLVGHSDWILSLAFSPDGTRLASGSTDLTVRLWRVADGVLLHEFSEPSEGITSLAFSPDGERLAAASSTSTAWIWDTRNAVLDQTIETGDQFISFVSFAPDSARLLTATNMPGMETVQVWELP